MTTEPNLLLEVDYIAPVSKWVPLFQRIYRRCVGNAIEQRVVHKEEFEKIKYLGIVNPRLGFTWTIAVKDIPQETIEMIDKDIIGY